MPEPIKNYFKAGGWVGVLFNAVILGLALYIANHITGEIAKSYTPRTEFNQSNVDWDRRVQALERVPEILHQIDLRTARIEEQLKEHTRQDRTK